MAVFDFEEQTTEESGAGSSPSDPGDTSGDMKTVSVLKSKNGDGYSQTRMTIPSKFVREMDLKKDDVLVVTRTSEGLLVQRTGQ